MSDDQGGCVGECLLWYWSTRVVPDKRPLNGCVCVFVCVYLTYLKLLPVLLNCKLLNNCDIHANRIMHRTDQYAIYRSTTITQFEYNVITKLLHNAQIS